MAAITGPSAPFRQVGDSRVIVKNVPEDVYHLVNPKYSDCRVKYKGGRTRRVNKVFLSRLQRLSLETLKSQTIFNLDDIEEFEAEMLVSWVYCEHLWSELPFPVEHHHEKNKTGTDTRIRAIQVARLYKVDSLERTAAASLRKWCTYLLENSPRMWTSDHKLEPYEVLGPLLRQAFDADRSQLTPEWVRNLVCSVVKEHKAALHADAPFCYMLREAYAWSSGDGRLALKGCKTCHGQANWASRPWEWEDWSA